jgi:ATP-dependent protease ClpP protease subunit
MKYLNLRDKDSIVLPLHGEINWQLTTTFNTVLLECFNRKHYKNVVVLIASSGGEPDPSWSLYSVLTSLGANIITVAVGKVYSAAVLPYLAGDSRYTLPRSMFLIHPTVACFHMAERNVHQLEDEVLNEKLDENLMCEVYKEKISEFFAKMYGHPKKCHFINADQSVDLKLSHQKVSLLSQIKVL